MSRVEYSDMDKPKSKKSHLITECIVPADGFDAEALICPICSCTYSHCNKPIEVLASDDYKAWAGRGSVIAIPFEGECGHCWRVCFAYHKGEHFIYVERLPDLKTDDEGNFL